MCVRVCVCVCVRVCACVCVCVRVCRYAAAPAAASAAFPGRSMMSEADMDDSAQEAVSAMRKARRGKNDKRTWGV